MKLVMRQLGSCVCLLALWAGISLLGISQGRADMMVPAGSTPTVTTGSVATADASTAASNLLAVTAELHQTQLTVQQSQAANAENVKLIAAQVQAFEQALISQSNNELDATHKMLGWTLILASAFGLGCLGIMLWMVHLQSQAFTQLTQISAQQNAMLGAATTVQKLAAPGRATVEDANTQLLDMVGKLKERVNELETTAHPLTNGNHTKPTNGAVATSETFLEENSPQKALEALDRHLDANPEDLEALLKKADTLQKLGRSEEALEYYDRVIATDGSLAVAHLQKGGLLNRLRRYDEALNCYEQALQAQEKRRR